MGAYQDLLNNLFTLGDQKYASFLKNLSNSDYKVIGIKIPVLRKIVKDNKNNLDLKLDDFRVGEYLEVDFIYFGLALSRANNIDEQLSFLKANIKKAKSWAITDTVSSYLKKCSFEKYFELFLKMYRSKYTYDRRTAYILGLKHYRSPAILEILKYINVNEEYMVYMAEAWLLATVAISFPNEIYSFLKGLEDLKLKRKTISKICESFRISEETKRKFKSLR